MFFLQLFQKILVAHFGRVLLSQQHSLSHQMPTFFVHPPPSSAVQIITSFLIEL